MMKVVSLVLIGLLPVWILISERYFCTDKNKKTKHSYIIGYGVLFAASMVGIWWHNPVIVWMSELIALSSFVVGAYKVRKIKFHETASHESVIFEVVLVLSIIMLVFGVITNIGKLVAFLGGVF